MRNIAVIIPSFNESESIKKLIISIFSLYKTAAIVIVDDNSPDGTATIVKALQKKYKNLYLIERKGKGGRGSAVIAGLKFAMQKLNAYYFIEMDADLLHNPEYIKKLIEKSKPKTMVIGSRYTKGGKWLSVSPRRKVMSIFANKLIQLVLQLSIADNTDGFRVYQINAAEIMLKHNFISSGYIVLSETSYLLSKHGFSFIEVPIICKNRDSKQSNTSLKEFLNALQMLFKIKNHINGSSF